eukprot:1154234-Pelagomonas_calceolata.AAC.2
MTFALLAFLQPFGFPKSLSDLKKRASVWFLKTFPTLDHLYRQQVLDGDAMILHLAERELHVQSHGDWRHQYYMPASAGGPIPLIHEMMCTYNSVFTSSSGNDNSNSSHQPEAVFPTPLAQPQGDYEAKIRARATQQHDAT